MHKYCNNIYKMGFFGTSAGKESSCNTGDPSWITGSGRSPGEGNGYPIQCSCQENPTDREAWWAAVQGVAKSWTWLNTHVHIYVHTHICIHIWKRIFYALCACVLVAQSCLTLCNPWTVAHQASLSVGFSRQEYWSGLPCPPPGDLPNPGIKPRSPVLEVGSLASEPILWEAHSMP